MNPMLTIMKKELYKQYFKQKNSDNGNFSSSTKTSNSNSERAKLQTEKAKQREKSKLETKNKSKQQIEQEQKQFEKRRIALYGDGVFKLNNNKNQNENTQELDQIDSKEKEQISAFLADSDEEAEENNSIEMSKKRSNGAVLNTFDDNDEPPLKKQKVSNKAGKYLPPQLRRLQMNLINSDGTDTNASQTELKRQIRPKLNRLTMNNLFETCEVIVSYYNGIGFANFDVTNVICECIVQMLDTSEETIGLNNIILILAGLIVCVYYRCGLLVASNLIESLTKEFKASLQLNTNDNERERKTNYLRESKFIPNMIRLFLYLYLLETISCKFIAQLLLDLVNNFISVENRADLFASLQIPMKC